MAKYNKNRYGSIILQDEKGNNFTITKKEQNIIKTYVKRANQRRIDKAKRYYEGIKNQENMRGISYESYMSLLNSKGFITEKYSSRMSQFKSKEDLKEFIKEIKTVTKRGYGNDRIQDIRKSLNKRIKEIYGSSGKVLIEQIKNIKDNQLLTLYLHNDDIIQNLYGSSEVSADELDNLVSKSSSDINFYLSKTKDTIKGKSWNKFKK